MKKLNTLLLLFTLGISSLVSAQCTLDASFTYSISGGTISFTNTSTNEPAGAYYDWSISTQTSGLENPSFSTAGFGATEWACLTVYDSTWTCWDSTCVEIAFDSTSTGCNLVANFSYTQSGDDIYFTNTSTDIPTGAYYDWTYNGQYSSSFSPTFSSIGASDGDYACLSVYDSLWTCTDSICMPIYLDSTGTGCNIDISFTYSAFGGNIYFTNTSTGVPVGASYDWWYGSQSSADENPIFNSVFGNEVVCLTIYDSSWICYDSVCTTVFVDSTADTTLTIPTQETVEFNVYPNPANQNLNITIENDVEVNRVEVMDLTGRIVIMENIENNDSTITLNVGDLPKGVYVIRIYDGNNSTKLSSRRFVKN